MRLPLLLALLMTLAPGQTTDPGPLELDVVLRTVQGPHVRFQPDPGIGGIAVELGIWSAEEQAPPLAPRPVLLRARSDADGMLRARLRVPEAWRRREGAFVWARVAEPGCMQRVATIRLERVGKLGKPPELHVAPGRTFTGVLFDASGEPVDAGTVYLVHDEPEGAVARGSTTTEANGRFTVHWARKGEEQAVRFLAWKAGLGVVLGEPCFPSRAADEPVELRLGSGLPLAGSVREPAGAPVGGLAITAVPVAGYPGNYRPFVGEGTGGLVVDRTVTDADGRFLLPSLAPGEYVLHGTYRPGRSIRADELGPVLGRAAVPSDEPAALISALPFIEVRVVDHQGAPADLAAALARGRDRAPAAPLLEVKHGPDWFWTLWGIRSGEAVIYPVERETEYLISWSEPGVPYREERASIAAQATRLPVRIQLERPGPPAQVTVRVLGPDGREPAVLPAVSAYAADSGLELATTVELDMSAWSNYSPGGWTVALPPGRYRFAASTPPFAGCVVPHPYPRTPCLPTEQELLLLGGDELELELRLGAAGHLDLEPLAPRPALTGAERDALVPDSVISEEVREAARARHGGAWVTLVGADGAEFPLRHFELPAFGALDYDLDWVVPGYSARGLDPAPVGEWTLRIERPGARLLERPLTIVAGEVTTVRW